MDKERNTAVAGKSQYVLESLSYADRRLLLIASLTLFLRRGRHGFRLTSDDLIRLAPYADSRGPDSEGMEAAA